jgi:hypothetical protein
LRPAAIAPSGSFSPNAWDRSFGLATLDARGRTFDALSLVDRARARTLIDIIATGRQPPVS